ncbi:MAG: ZIP family metal transporter [Eubacteriales bacterium]|nr:ZIP family metal transporter [Eubacteriales bacterium]
MQIFLGLMIPFIGTTLGSACVFFMRRELKPLVQKAFLGFASGVMVAASVWSLLIPAMDMSGGMGKFAFIPAAAGFSLGIAFLLLMDKIVPHLHLGCDESEGPKCSLKKTTMLVLAVTIHNIPEGLSAGAVFAGAISGNDTVTIAGAFALAVGIAIQNFPEGAIISMPLRGDGSSRGKAFLYGTLSGAVEPVAGGVTLLLAAYITPVLPYLLSFAAGAMIYVVVEELIPEASEGEHSNVGTIAFGVGFVVMMILDVALG